MALVLIEGFDHMYNSATLTQKSWTSVVYASSFEAGRLSGQSLRILGQQYGSTVTKALPSTYSTVIVGFAFKGEFAEGATIEVFRFLQSDGTLIARVAINLATTKYAIYDASYNLVASSAGDPINRWTYLELKLVIAGASGSITTHVNGVEDIAATTHNFGSANVGAITLMSDVRASNICYFDDLYVADTSGAAPRNTWLGDVRVATIMPSGAGTTANWTANTGSNYAAVDEISGTFPDGDTTYVSSSTAGDIDTYAYDNLSSSFDTVYAVQTNINARKDEAGLREIAPVIRQSTTNYIGASQALSTDYGFFTEIWQQDPTGSNWTKANVNADEFGVKLVT